jgi:hypothetical protein
MARPISSGEDSGSDVTAIRREDGSNRGCGVKRLLVGATAVLLLIAGTSCHNHVPRTRSMVYNISMSTFTLEDHEVAVNASWSVFTKHGAVDTVELKRGAVVGRLVITSLVPAGDPNDYDAAINVHEDTAGVLYCREFSPYISAEIIAP